MADEQQVQQEEPPKDESPSEQTPEESSNEANTQEEPLKDEPQSEQTPEEPSDEAQSEQTPTEDEIPTEPTPQENEPSNEEVAEKDDKTDTPEQKPETETKSDDDKKDETTTEDKVANDEENDKNEEQVAENAENKVEEPSPAPIQAENDVPKEPETKSEEPAETVQEEQKEEKKPSETENDKPEADQNVITAVEKPTEEKVPVKDKVEPPPQIKLVPIPFEKSENFWLDGNYKKVVRRIEDGSKLLDDLSKLIHERAEIESLYANKIKSWQRKWTEASGKSFEYGTAHSSVIKGFQEGTDVADLHIAVSGRLEELSRSIQQWRSENYPKAVTMKLKEVKRSEEAFVKAQKPWVIKYNEANKCMKAYHSANHLLKIANAQVLEAKNSQVTTPPEQLTKLHAKVKKSEQDIITTKEKYEEALRDISSYNQKYQGDMVFEFDRCQKFEETRRNYVKEKLLHFHMCIDRTMFADTYKKIYTELLSQYGSINVPTDLVWYQESYGVNHPFITLSYVEYDEKIHGQIEESNVTAVGQPKTKQNTSPKPKKSGVCTTL